MSYQISMNKSFPYSELFDIKSCLYIIIWYPWIHRIHVPSIISIIYILWQISKSLQKTQSIKNSKISISKADIMSKKLTAFRLILFFINHNILSSVFWSVPRRPRSEHTSRISPKESMFKVNLFSYSFGD